MSWPVRNYFCTPFGSLSEKFSAMSHLSIVLCLGSAMQQHNKTFIMSLPVQAYFSLSDVMLSFHQSTWKEKAGAKHTQRWYWELRVTLRSFWVIGVALLWKGWDTIQDFCNKQAQIDGVICSVWWFTGYPGGHCCYKPSSGSFSFCILFLCDLKLCAQPFPAWADYSQVFLNSWQEALCYQCRQHPCTTTFSLSSHIARHQSRRGFMQRPG